jgi:hypothetical protein
VGSDLEKHVLDERQIALDEFSDLGAAETG